MNQKNNIDSIFNELLSLSYEKFVDYLLNKKFNIENKNCQGENLLHLCVFQGLIEKFYTLVYMGAKTDITNNKGDNILHYACLGSNDLYLTQEIAKKYISPISKNNEGNTPMHYCDNINDIIYFYNWCAINRIKLKDLTNNLHENIAQFAHKNNFKNTLLWENLINEQ